LAVGLRLPPSIPLSFLPPSLPALAPKCGKRARALQTVKAFTHPGAAEIEKGGRRSIGRFTATEAGRHGEVVVRWHAGVPSISA
jgi:hypothetical protein